MQIHHLKICIISGHLILGYNLQDGLHHIGDCIEAISGYPLAILTPNVVEFDRLCRQVNLHADDSDDAVVKLAAKLQLIIVRKGATDVISDGRQCKLLGKKFASIWVGQFMMLR